MLGPAVKGQYAQRPMAAKKGKMKTKEMHGEAVRVKHVASRLLAWEGEGRRGWGGGSRVGGRGHFSRKRETRGEGREEVEEVLQLSKEAGIGWRPKGASR